MQRLKNEIQQNEPVSTIRLILVLNFSSLLLNTFSNEVKEKTNRTRTRASALSQGQDLDIEHKLCKCSDLNQLPSPRVVLLGKTGT